MNSALCDGVCRHGPLRGKWLAGDPETKDLDGGHYEWRASWRFWEWVPESPEDHQLLLFPDDAIRLPGAEIHMSAYTPVPDVRRARAG